MNMFFKTCKKDWFLIKKTIYKESMEIEALKNNVSINKLVNYLISAEDHRFRYHLGFDIIAIIRALRNRIIYKKKEGASTIEQQLVRTIVGRYEKSLNRKLREICLAFFLKILIDKKIIALTYLNIGYYGTNYIGLDSILKKFNLRKGDYINDDVCAEIVSRLKYPEPTIKNIKLKQIDNRKKYLLKLFKKHANYRLISIHGKY